MALRKWQALFQFVLSLLVKVLLLERETSWALLWRGLLPARPLHFAADASGVTLVPELCP